jgi:hypothetical protein
MSLDQTASFSLHPGIDVDALRETYAAFGRLQISPFIEEEGARALRAHLLARSDWEVALNVDGKQNRVFSPESWSAMSGAHREALKSLAAPTSLKSFRFHFEQIVVTRDEAGPEETETLLGRFAAFMSSPPVLELMREVTGAQDIGFADARATAYGREHFLTMHHDEADGHQRRSAYVFGLTEAWRPEWGGLLLFHDSSDDIVQGLMPRMNALSLFAVPQDHSVSQVSAAAPHPRYSVTGWLRPARLTEPATAP